VPSDDGVATAARRPAWPLWPVGEESGGRIV